MTAPVRLALGRWALDLSGPEAVVSPLAAVLAGLSVQGESPPALEIEVAPDRASATGSVGARPLWTIALPASGWLGTLVGHTVATLATLLTRLLFVHAGAVSVDGRGCMVVGESGAGKTSLIASLTRLGAQYVCDDLALLDPQTRHLLPVSVPLAVKPWTARAAGALPSGHALATEGGTRFWQPDRAAGGPVPADAFLFLRRGGRSARVRGLPRARALLALAGHASSFSHRHRVEEAFAGFAGALGSARCLAVEARTPAGCAADILSGLRGGSRG